MPWCSAKPLGSWYSGELDDEDQLLAPAPYAQIQTPSALYTGDWTNTDRFVLHDRRSQRRGCHLVRTQRDELTGGRQMLAKTAVGWPPQPSTLIGFGVLAGALCYVLTGDPIWAAVAAAAVKILVPDNSTSTGQALKAITMLAEAIGSPPHLAVQPETIGSSDPRADGRAVCREGEE
jgi:hypothetical protein